MAVEVIYKQYCMSHYDGDYEDEDCQYTEESYDTTIEGIKWSKNPDVYAGFKPEKDTDYYLLYATYTTGNSFGRESGLIDFILLTKTREEAESVMKMLESIKEHEFKSPIHIKDDFKYCIPWFGYFESLDNIDIQTVRLVK